MFDFYAHFMSTFETWNADKYLKPRDQPSLLFEIEQSMGRFIELSAV